MSETLTTVLSRPKIQPTMQYALKSNELQFLDVISIKTHGSESRSQETTKRTPQLKRAATTVSYLRVETVSQY